jgi:hypothetical protein
MTLIINHRKKQHFEIDVIVDQIKFKSKPSTLIPSWKTGPKVLSDGVKAVKIGW